MTISEHQWLSAKLDAEILEQKISSLIEAFEQAHTPIQCSVLTRWRDHTDKYSKTKGGAAQIKLHETLSETGEISIKHDCYWITPITHLIYVEEIPMS